MPRLTQMLLDHMEVRVAIFAEVIEDRGQRIDGGLVVGNFAIEHAQRVGGGAALAIGAQRGRDGCQFLFQRGHELGPAVGIADGIENQVKVFQARMAQELDHHFDHLGVDDGRFRADGLRADLKELAVAALLRALAAEHGSDVVELLDAGDLVEAVLDIGAHHGGGGLRAERERRAVAVLPGVHFFADDVGIFAHAAGEERGLFEDGRADFVIVESAEHFARLRLDAVPDGAGGRQNIARSFDCFDHADLINETRPCKWRLYRRSF